MHEICTIAVFPLPKTLGVKTQQVILLSKCGSVCSGESLLPRSLDPLRGFLALDVCPCSGGIVPSLKVKRCSHIGSQLPKTGSD